MHVLFYNCFIICVLCYTTAAVPWLYSMMSSLVHLLIPWGWSQSDRPYMRLGLCLWLSGWTLQTHPSLVYLSFLVSTKHSVSRWFVFIIYSVLYWSVVVPLVQFFLHNTCINMLATRLHVHIYDVFMFRQSLHKVFQQPADGPEFPPGTTTPL